MDNIEVESNGSFSLDSLRSDVSSLLGLSAYGAEFADLKRLVNDSEHYEQISVSSSTSEANRDLITKEYEKTITYLQGNFKDANRIQKLVKTNRQLEEELEKANKQIERLIHNYRNKQDLQAFQGTLDLENENYQLKLHYSKLQKQSAALQEERDELNRENAHLKVSLEECTMERDIQLKSINSLKEKICELHVANENMIKYISNLKFTRNVLNARLLDLYKSRIWYKKQLAGCQHTKSTLHGELISCKSEVANYINQISSLTVDLIKCKNDYEQAQIQASKGKLAIPITLPFDIKKYEELLASCAASVEKSAVLSNTASQEDAYIQTIAEFKEEIGQIRAANLDNHRNLDNLKCKNSATVARNLSLETILMQKDLNIKLLTCSKNDLIVQVECLRVKNKEQLSENQQLKRSLLILEVKLQHSEREKENVENCIQVIRDQSIGLNKIYQKVKDELYLKTTELDTFKENFREAMDNWTVCKLRQNKLETLIARLRKDNESYESSIKELKDQLRNVELKTARNLQVEKNEKLELCEERQFPQEERIAFETPRTSSEIGSQHSHDNCYNAISKKTISVLELTNVNMDTFSQHHLERITDDQKVELLFNNQPFPNSLKSNVDVKSASLIPFHNIKNCTAKLHFEGFEKGMDTTLEYLADPINVYGRRLNPEYDSAELQINTIKALKILLQVKEREIQGKRKKMDTNNRILLRKVKEHMRGRNATEKQLKQLQELCSHLACDRNNLKMLLNSRDSELKTLQDVCEDFKVESEMQRTSIVILEYQLRKIQACWKCMKLQENNQCLEAELGQTKNDVELLQSKNNVLETKVLSQQQQIATLSSENEGKKRKNVQHKELLEKLQSQLGHADKHSEKNEQLNAKLAACVNRNEIHSNELQTRSSNFHRFVEFCQELQQQVDGLKNRLFQEKTNFQKHITDYKSKMQRLQIIIQVLHNDRSFLHRISRDLKWSLNSCMERNQKLQAQIRLFSSDSQVLKRRSRFLDDRLPLGNWDDTSINQLLQKCSGSLDKAIVGGLQNDLNGLRDEIFNLQEQILRKNSETY